MARPIRRSRRPAPVPAARRAAPAGRARRTAPADPARRAAYDVLRAVADRDAYANLLLPSLLAERGLAGRDAAFATELTYGTLRGRGTYDAILAACSDRAELDPPVRDVLRLGVHQLLATRVGQHAAVATSVDLAKAVCGPRPSGFVNAVLRRVATRDLDAWLGIVVPDRSQDATGYLAIRYSYPRWIVDAFRAALGETPPPGTDAPTSTAETEAALAAGNARPEVVLALTPAGTAAAGPSGPAEAGLDGFAGQRTEWSPYGFRLAGGDPASLVASGLAAVQDEASQLAALALARASAPEGSETRAVPEGSETRAAPEGSETRAAPEGSDARAAPGGSETRDRLWLDLCAGPGGKARLLGRLAAERGVHLVASDIRPHRARRVAEALQRSGQDDAVVVADGRHAPWRPGTFDRVLADVPCSGLGSLRRRPEARWRKTPADAAALTALQRDLLNAAIDSARPGGLIAYVTCSPHLAETQEVVTAVAAGRGDVNVLDAPAVLPEVPALRAADPRFAQFWPHRHHTDAIFIALLSRR